MDQQAPVNAWGNKNLRSSSGRGLASPNLYSPTRSPSSTSFAHVPTSSTSLVGMQTSAHMRRPQSPGGTPTRAGDPFLYPPGANHAVDPESPNALHLDVSDVAQKPGKGGPYDISARSSEKPSPAPSSSHSVQSQLLNGHPHDNKPLSLTQFLSRCKAFLVALLNPPMFLSMLFSLPAVTSKTRWHKQMVFVYRIFLIAYIVVASLVLFFKITGSSERPSIDKLSQVGWSSLHQGQSFLNKMPSLWQVGGNKASVVRQSSLARHDGNLNLLDAMPSEYRLSKIHEHAPEFLSSEIVPFFFTAAGDKSSDITACLYLNEAWLSLLPKFLENWGGSVSLVLETAHSRSDEASRQRLRDSITELRGSNALVRDLVDIHVVGLSSDASPNRMSRAKYRTLVSPKALNVHLNVARFFARSDIVVLVPDARLIPSRGLLKRLLQYDVYMHVTHQGNVFAVPTFAYSGGQFNEASDSATHSEDFASDADINSSIDEELIDAVAENEDSKSEHAVRPRTWHESSLDELEKLRRSHNVPRQGGKGNANDEQATRMTTAAGYKKKPKQKINEAIVVDESIRYENVYPEIPLPRGDISPRSVPADVDLLEFGSQYVTRHLDRLPSLPESKDQVIQLVQDTDFVLFDDEMHPPNRGPTNWEHFMTNTGSYPVAPFRTLYAPPLVLSKSGHPWCAERFESMFAACVQQIFLAGANIRALADEWFISLRDPAQSDRAVIASADSYEYLHQLLADRLYKKFIPETCMHHARELLFMRAWDTDKARHLRKACKAVFRSRGLEV